MAPSFRSRRVTYTRGYFSAGQLDVRIRLVVAQQDVEARLVLLDQVVFERQRLFFVIDQDVVDIARLADQRPVLTSASCRRRSSCGPAMPQDFGLADVDDPAVRVLVQIHSGRER